MIKFIKVQEKFLHSASDWGDDGDKISCLKSQQIGRHMQFENFYFDKKKNSWRRVYLNQQLKLHPVSLSAVHVHDRAVYPCCQQP